MSKKTLPHGGVLRIVVSNDSREPPEPVKNRRLALDPEASLDDAMADVLSACIEHFTANWPALRETSAPESIHQMRVALRRLRAAVGVFRRAARCDVLETASQRAKTIAATLGEARDWDVFREGLDALSAPLAEEPSYAALRDAAEARRRRGHQAAYRMIDDPATTRFAADLGAALTQRPWRGDDALEKPGSARKFAAKALDRLHRRAKRACENLAGLSVEERHEARIALKKLRYAAEFFESLFEARGAAKSYIKAVTAAQDGLGAENDMAVATRLVHEIERGENGAETAHAAGFVQGWRAHAREEAGRRLGKVEKTVLALEPFWR